MRRLPFAPRLAALALSLLVLAVLASCEDGLGPLPEDRLEGLVILDGSEVVVRYSAVTKNATGSLDVQVGEERTFTVMLLGRDEEFIPFGLMHALREPVLVVTTVIASAERTGRDGVRVTGNRAGNTTLLLEVLQGQSPVVPDASIPIRVGG